MRLPKLTEGQSRALLIFYAVATAAALAVFLLTQEQRASDNKAAINRNAVLLARLAADERKLRRDDARLSRAAFRICLAENDSRHAIVKVLKLAEKFTLASPGITPGQIVGVEAFYRNVTESIKFRNCRTALASGG